MNPKPRWGILSTAKIGREKVIPALLKSDKLVVAGLASRDLAAAEALCKQFAIAKAYDSYEALLADPEIDIVYNPLPNHLHVEWTQKAAAAGKHVLCEKPFALKAADLEVLRPYTSRVHIAEAFMVRHHPQWIQARERIRAGEIGRLNSILAPFSYFNADPANIRNQAQIGGGALYDIGCYAITAGRWFFEREPLRVVASIYRDAQLQTDSHSAGLLDFGGGQHLGFTVSTQSAAQQRLHLIGERGHLEIEIPFNAPLGESTRYFHTRSGLLREDAETIVVAPCDQYQIQAENFSAQTQNSPPNAADLDASVATMRVIDALFASEKSAGFVNL